MARIPEEKIDEILSSINIVHYVSQFVRLKKAGSYYKGLCPFHTEKTPSFTVSPERQIFHCFGCGRGGNIFRFIMDYEKLSFPEALQRAAEFAGILLPRSTERSPEEESYFERLYRINESACRFFEQNLFKPQHKKHLEYFKERRLSGATIKAFRLGFAPDSYDRLLKYLQKEDFPLEEIASLGLVQKKEKGNGYYAKFRQRIIFPFQNIGGKILGFGGRRLREEQQPKYLNSPENPIYKKGKILYGLHQAIESIRHEGYVVLVEGYFDLLRLVENGFRHVVAGSGTALGDEQIKLMRRYTDTVYVAYDGDQAGIKAALRSATLIERGNLNAFIIPLPAKDDPDTFVLNNGLPAFLQLIGKRLLPIDFRIDHFRQNHPSAGIESKNVFIDETLNNLLELKNTVKIGLYLHQLSERLQINESLLFDQLNHLKRYRRNRPEPSAEEERKQAEPVLTLRGAYKAETGILSLLLNKNPEAREIVMQEVSLDLFENEALVQLYDFLLHAIEDKGLPEPQQVINAFQEDARLSRLLSEILLIEFDDPLKFAKDCIYQLKKWQLEKKSREISLLIKEDRNSPESVLHYTQELMEIRRQMDRLERKQKIPNLAE